MRRIVYLLIIYLSQISTSAFSEVELEYELDPYYSNVGLFIPFETDSIPTVELKNEPQIYITLLKDIFTPRFFVVELSANPLPILGVYLNEEESEFYDEMDLSKDLNLVAALTEGFEEPYALSFFLGNVIKFTLPKKKNSEAINKGYSGFLISVGDRHIRSNQQFNDQWYEIEWKLKGDRRIDNIYHSFSFRVGIKRHDRVDISDSYYFGLRRELFNSKIGEYQFGKNVGTDLRLDFSRENDSLIQSQIFFDKHWPTTKGEFTFGIGIKKIKDKYHGALDYLNEDLQLILRPGFKF